jgi:hypothetical protein
MMNRFQQIVTQAEDRYNLTIPYRDFFQLIQRIPAGTL